MKNYLTFVNESIPRFKIGDVVCFYRNPNKAIVIDVDIRDYFCLYRIEFPDGYMLWTAEDNLYVQGNSFSKKDEDSDGEFRRWKNGKIQESIDPLSGTTDIKMNVEGNNFLINQLIDNMSLIVQKRSSKSLRIKSIYGYINKEIHSRHNLYYDTYLEISMINKDFITAEYKSVNSNIVIKINDDIVYDMVSKRFDNEILFDKIITEYKKYLKINKFIIKENYSKKDDIVYVYGTVDEIEFRYNRGKIILTKDEFNSDYLVYDYLILFDDRFNDELHSAEEYSELNLPDRCYYVYKENVITEEKYLEKERKRLKNVEKYKEFDPYGEEDWDY